VIKAGSGGSLSQPRAGQISEDCRSSTHDLPFVRMPLLRHTGELPDRAVSPEEQPSVKDKERVGLTVS
jgi:hypothetical protein